MTRNQKKMHMRKMMIQKLMGAALIFISVSIVAFVINTSDPDITAALILGPAGLWMMFSKKCLIY